jgi:hypothetical protein
MPGSFGSRLRGMMTFNTRDLGTLNAAILGDMVEVAELNNPQLCLRSENDDLLGLSSVLRRSLNAESAGYQQDR